jgi:hypothetical protein
VDGVKLCVKKHDPRVLNYGPLLLHRTESFMEVGLGPNEGCSAKTKTKKNSYTVLITAE